MGFGNLLTQLYNQLNPFVPGAGSSSSSGSSSSNLSGNVYTYVCQGYEKDLAELGKLEKTREVYEEALRRLNISLDVNQNYQGVLHAIKQVQDCLSNPANLFAGEPNTGLYIGIGVGAAAGIGGLAWYLKSRGKKSEKAKQ